MSVQDYYSEFIALWAEFTDIASTYVTGDTLSRIQEIHKISRRDQFLMKLRPKFEMSTLI